ncbi:MAG: ComF family protein [Bacteroidales bacterium]|nr:ComF family protein [Bacteroidales bacterium]
MRPRGVIRGFLDALFPRECHLCGNILSGETLFICDTCRAALPRTNYHRLPGNAMEQRFMGRFPYQRAAGHFFYSRDSDIARLIHDFKYHNFPGLAREFGRFVGQEIAITPFFDGVDIIVPVPLHWKRILKRGYNQSLEIAKGLSEATGLPVVQSLKAVQNHRTQTSMSRSSRIDNIEGVFSVGGSDLSGKGVLIVDDVCTTGATLAEAAITITRKYPSCKVSLLTIGVTF